MKLTIQVKMLLLSVALVIGGFALADYYLTAQIERDVFGTTRDDLLVRAKLGGNVASMVTAPLSDLASWDFIADRLGASADARVTIIRPDGVVIGDSALDLAAVQQVQNHKDRPEVIGALAEGAGVASRHSATLGVDELYVAVPFQQSTGVAGVVRVAKPLRAILLAIEHVRNILLVGAGLSLVITNLVTFLMASLIAQGLKTVTSSVRKLIAGDFGARTGLATSDEVGDLGRAVDELAIGVSARLQQGPVPLHGHSGAPPQPGSYLPPKYQG